MYPVSPRFLEAIRAPHAITATAVHTNMLTDVQTDLPITDGSVTVDSTAAIRRILNLTLPPLQTVWDTLDTVGGEIAVWKALRYVDGTVETVPLGTFIVDIDAIGHAPGDTITLTCPDRWLRVQRNKFSSARASVPSNLGWQEIQRLIEGAWVGAFPGWAADGATESFPGWSSIDKTAATKVGSVLWDSGDREAAITTLCADNSVEAFFDALGQAVLRPVPLLTPTGSAVWTVDAGPNGVLVGADDTRDRSRVHNAIRVDTSATDVTFPTVEVRNTTPGDPLNVTGPLGYVPLDYSSPTLRNSAQARAAGLTILSRNLGIAHQVTLSASPNPALDAGDMIRVVLPALDRGGTPTTVLHMIDTVTIPLTETGVQDLSTRSTRPDTDGTGP